MPGKTAAPHELPYALEADEPPSMEAASKPLAEQTHKRLNEIAPKQIVGVAEKQLLIANASGVVTAVTASGDVTNDKSGVFTIGNEKIESKHVKDGTLTTGDLAASAKPLTWYKAVSIPAEESRTSTEFGTLTTKDEIAGIEVPTNGLVAVNYAALVKSTVSEAGRVALFIGSNQLKSGGNAVDSGATTSAGVFSPCYSYPGGLIATASGASSFGSTGEVLGLNSSGGPCYIFNIPAGTYVLSVRYRATSGSITAKERKLWATVYGF